MGTRTIRARFKVNGVLTDPTTAKLSDATATYGVKRDDTDAVVVADGTDMTQEATGIYSYSFTSVDGVAYTGWGEFVYGGNTYRKEYQFEAASAGDALLTITYSYLRREIGRFLGYGRDPDEWEASSEEAVDVEDVLKSGIRRVLSPPPLPGEKYAHEWSFLRPDSTFSTTTPYTTGTVEVVDGVVTLTDGTFPSWATQGMLTIASGTYSVASRSSNTEIILNDTTLDADAGTTYSLGRTMYDMPDNFAMIEGPLVYSAGQSVLQSPIQRMSVHQVMNELTFEVSAGYPRRFAIRPKAIDMTAGTKYEIILSPTPDGVYTFHYYYRIEIPALDGSNTTPPGGDAHGELYLEACLAAAEEKLHDAGDLHTKRFWECLAASVSHDRKNSCPDTLGFNQDRSDGPMIDYENHFWTNTGLTRYNGTYP